MSNKILFGINIPDEPAYKTKRMQWVGPSKIAPAWFGVPFVGIGVAALYLAYSALSIGLFGAILATFLGIVGTSFSLAGALTLYLTSRIPLTVTIEQLSRTLNCTDKEVRVLVRDNDIIPPYSVNGREYYRPEDFAATSLLRGSNATAGREAETLLRSANTCSSYSQPEELLRPSGMEPQLTIDATSTQSEPAVKQAQITLRS